MTTTEEAWRNPGSKFCHENCANLFRLDLVQYRQSKSGYPLKPTGANMSHGTECCSLGLQWVHEPHIILDYSLEPRARARSRTHMPEPVASACCRNGGKRTGGWGLRSRRTAGALGEANKKRSQGVDLGCFDKTLESQRGNGTLREFLQRTSEPARRAHLKSCRRQERMCVASKVNQTLFAIPLSKAKAKAKKTRERARKKTISNIMLLHAVHLLGDVWRANDSDTRAQPHWR